MPSGTTERDPRDATDISGDVPPEVEELQMAILELTSTAAGAFMNLYEACKKIPNGDELAAASLIASRKIKELGEALFDSNNAINVKSTEFDLTGARNDDTATGAQNNLYEYLVSKGIIGSNSTT